MYSPRLSSHHRGYLVFRTDLPYAGIEDLPHVQYYLMGANEWKQAAEWPVPGTSFECFYLHSRGAANSASGDVAGVGLVAAPLILQFWARRILPAATSTQSPQWHPATPSYQALFHSSAYASTLREHFQEMMAV